MLNNLGKPKVIAVGKLHSLALADWYVICSPKGNALRSSESQQLTYNFRQRTILFGFYYTLESVHVHFSEGLWIFPLAQISCSPISDLNTMTWIWIDHDALIIMTYIRLVGKYVVRNPAKKAKSWRLTFPEQKRSAWKIKGTHSFLMGKILILKSLCQRTTKLAELINFGMQLCSQWLWGLLM